MVAKNEMILWVKVGDIGDGFFHMDFDFLKEEKVWFVLFAI